MRWGQCVRAREIPYGVLAAGPRDQGCSVRLFSVPPKQTLRFKIGGDFSTSEGAGDDVIHEAMPDVTPRTLPACESMMSIHSDRLPAAAGMRSDQGGTQAQAHCDTQLFVSESEPKRVGWESLQPCARPLRLYRQQSGACG